ncbi:EAL domain-containing protein [Peteryoungia desertarenae]|uniref:EAL domain-containing protein n=1 Tax=Peteryoungia desertarenae TaxID=1813451 RepID=A0ABX6QQP9_9HYPH|nr:EAL domain-containing protein [Peteryoungia desertarenae]QLF70532.1 EAL domain-containing protein [Peteryoungia desertarenae]
MWFSEETRGAFLSIVKQAQAEDIYTGQPSAIAFNLVVSLCATSVTYLHHGILEPVLIWQAIFLLILIIRGLSVLAVRKLQLAQNNPQFTLFIFALGAALSGISWAALPFTIDGFAPLGIDAGICLIMGGMATGSVVKQIGYTPVSMFFAVPILASMQFQLLNAGTLPETIVGAALAALIFIFIRQSLWVEHIFVSNQLARHDATALADSLTRANSDILKQNRRLEALANQCTLTGLANRGNFNSRLMAEIARAKVLNERTAILVLDVDRFKSINDTLGHSAGDTVLCEIAARLRSTIRDNSLIARMGGDEFAVIVTGRNAAERAREHGAAMIEAGRNPIGYSATRSVVGVSIGMAVFPDHGSTAEELLASADMALYDAKSHGRRQLREFAPDLRRKADFQRMVEQDLEAAIESGEVTAWFQPQVCLTTNRLVGFEALVRWQHPSLGFVSPPDIVSAAHAVHLADKLTRSMVDHACRLSLKLASIGLSNLPVAVNVSPREFALYSVADILDSVTSRHGVSPSSIEIEITEEAILDPDIAGAQLKQIESAGYKLAVDDFGMGHSSLAYLIGLRIDRLKIDRSFADQVAKSEINQKLVSALVSLGHSLDIEVLIEGVETPEDAATLARLGCTVGQGYLFARPMAEPVLMEWLVKHEAESTRKPTGKSNRLTVI